MHKSSKQQLFVEVPSDQTFWCIVSIILVVETLSKQNKHFDNIVWTLYKD